MFLAKYKSVFFNGGFVCLFIIALFYYWFVLADRYVIFLYNHLGATPFDERTISRYWMCGFVASGAVFVLYIVANWFSGRFAGLYYRNYHLPVWWQVWLFCVVPISVGILFITMTFNTPTLPFSVAITCVITTLIGLALALSVSSLAVQKPAEFGWLVTIGAGLIPSFLLLRAVELPYSGLATTSVAYSVAIGGTLIGTIWSIIMTWLQTRLYRVRYKGIGIRLFVIGLCLSYLLLPLVHYLFFTPQKFRYISTSANFFALNENVQFLSLLAGVLLAMGLDRLQKKWQK